jgi:Tfp pilus assembly protein PilF
MMNIRWKISMLILVFACISAGAEAPSLKQLYHQHRWFELRKAIKDKRATDLYSGATASAFHDDKDAEKYLNQVIRSTPDSKDAVEAHEKLADLYVRSGMSREAVQQFDAILKIEPGRQDIKDIRPIFVSFGRHPDQSIGSQRRTTVHAEISNKGLVIPLSIHGKTLH